MLVPMEATYVVTTASREIESKYLLCLKNAQIVIIAQCCKL